MQRTRQAGTPIYQVMALFADAAPFFRLPKGATFGDLAGRVDQLGERHVGMPMAIYLKFRIAHRPAVEHPSGYEPDLLRDQKVVR